MTKRIDQSRAAELRRTWEAKRKMWLTEAKKLRRLAMQGPAKFRYNRLKAYDDAVVETKKYERLIAELDAIINGDE